MWDATSAIARIVCTNALQQFVCDEKLAALIKSLSAILAERRDFTLWTSSPPNAVSDVTDHVNSSNR